MIVWLFLASLAFGFTMHVLDRPAVPSWQGKYAYRAVAFVCWLGWVATAFKAVAWWTELRTLMPFCR